MRPSIFALLFLLSLFSQGQSWQKVEGLYGGSTEFIKATSKSIFVTVREKGLFCSFDTGKTWTPTIIKRHVDQLMTEKNLMVAISTGTVFVSTDHGKTIREYGFINDPHQAYLKDGRIYVSGYWSGNKMSADTGRTWLLLPDGFKDMKIEGPHWYVGFITFSVSHDHGQTFTEIPRLKNVRSVASFSNHVWVLSQDSIFHSTDFGNSWTQVSHGPFGQDSKLHFHDDTLYLFNLDYHSELVYSPDMGKSWSKFPISGPIASQLWKDQLWFSGKKFRTGGGVWESTDNMSWQACSKGLRHDQIVEMKVFEGILFVESRCQESRSQLKYSTDQGDTWNIVSDLDSSAVGWKDFTFGKGKLFAADWHKGVYLSLDTGKTWQFIACPISFGVKGMIYSNGVLYFGEQYIGDAVFMTSDLGVTWKTQPLPKQGYWSLHFSSSADAVLYTAYWNGNVMKSEDDGTTWSNCSPDTLQPVSEITFSGSHFFIAANSEIWRADDKAQNWSIPIQGFGHEFRRIAASGKEVITSSRDTLYYSSNLGSSWSKLAKPLLSVENNTINTVAADGDYIYVALNAESIWRVNLLTASQIEHAVSGDLSAMVYPNPSSTSSHFKIKESTESQKRIWIYNIQGELIHQSNFTGAEYTFHREVTPGGLYLYTIVSDQGTYSGKLLLE